MLHHLSYVWKRYSAGCFSKRTFHHQPSYFWKLSALSFEKSLGVWAHTVLFSLAAWGRLDDRSWKRDSRPRCQYLKQLLSYLIAIIIIHFRVPSIVHEDSWAFQWLCLSPSLLLGLVVVRINWVSEFPHTNRDYMWWVLSNSQWTKVISHATSILGEPVTWNAVLLPSVDPFSNFEGMDRFKSHVLQFWMATTSEWSQRSKIRYWYAEEIWEA